MPHRPIAALLFCLCLGCGDANQFQPPPPPEVTVAKPVQAMVADRLEATGVTEAYESVDVRARVKGFLQSAGFVEGSSVKKDQPLFIIDPRPFQADLDVANASVLVAQARKASAIANHKQAKTQAANDLAQYNRAKRAAVGGGVTDAELEELLTTYRNSEAGIEVAQANISAAEAEMAAANAAVRQAQLDYDYTQVTSPIEGRVGRRHVDVGNLVGAGESTLLTRVVKQNPVYATFSISEADLIQFKREAQKEGGELNVPRTGANSDIPVFIGLIDEEDCPHEGRFDYSDLDLDQQTGTKLIRAKIPNDDLMIPIGAFVRVQVPGKPQPRLLIPDSAIGRDQNGSYVAVVDSANTVSRKRIVTGHLHQGMRVIKNGLSPEDRVIVLGIQRARPGGKVTPSSTGVTPKTDP